MNGTKIENNEIYYYTGTMKYILVTGGVISGLGKGVISSSIGKFDYNNTSWLR